MLSSRQLGSILDGKYKIVEPLGSGRMGEVYLVRHMHLQELRVIKNQRKDLQTEPTAQKCFTREARLATQIKHPNVLLFNPGTPGSGGPRSLARIPCTLAHRELSAIVAGCRLCRTS